ncbi:hypothetical protein J529_4658 [Acinetobacter baumannii 99063]|uniref:Uncharacterized protein n=1 Tax=Acinetobacter baumannii 99063 TaxID=1310630 RepID=A0A009R6F7_ACIBA|nr:hypothetical protein J529_4741 [Acinetobacter baumannii 99063]EXC35610.1 hypothetical protein J529_4691 [Acinetobacter baumannii 99063]EXC35760.1 hypothetical protein J529_4658 [Acinetobacter baumannii 99063]
MLIWDLYKNPFHLKITYIYFLEVLNFGFEVFSKTTTLPVPNPRKK